jgi:uncharacterized membrane protein YhaH (DUF805 family)
MTDPATPSVPAGWYPDPDVAGGQRWWSGIEWTEYRTPPAAAPQYAAQPYAAQPYAASPYAAPQYAYAPAAAQLALPPDAWPYVGQAAPLGTAVPLWAPLYGATMAQAWTRFWRKYADFSGRASRSEYWLAYLWFVILIFGSYFVFAVIFALVGGISSTVDRSGGSAAVGIGAGVFGLLWLGAYIAAMIPMIAVSVRRLHDAGYPGYYFFMGFIPLVGGILLLVYLVTESRPQGAIYDLPR